jgi:mannobiose 2-epimerase
MNYQIKWIRFAIFYFILLLIFSGCTSTIIDENQKLLDEIDNSLKSEILDIWYPLAVDRMNGGFLSDFTYDWKPNGPQNKMLVTQTRHVWTASQAAMFYDNDRYKKIAEHGFHFLKEKMWDEIYGGFYMLRTPEGRPIDRLYQDEKRAYGIAFAIYALATYYEMSGDTIALELAQKSFLWLDEHSHDPEYKGYFDQMKKDGTWVSRAGSDIRMFDSASVHWKDQNSSIHLLEAFTELYKVWQDNLLRERLMEMLGLIRDTITTENGYLTLFLERDWTPVSFRDSSNAVREAKYFFDHVSFGHDVEAAYLMLEASNVLGLESDATALTIAKKMVDHALANGWDNEYGGFYDAGYYFTNSDTCTIINNEKTWWVQAEGLNALLLMSKLFPDEKKYDNAFKKQWEYIKKYLIDHEYGGWYWFGLDKNPERQKAAKGSDWKVNYHNTRALMNCIKMLKSEYELIK